jgi:hypothetical protein
VVAPSTKRGQAQQPHGRQQQQRPERGSLDSAQRRRRWSVVGWSVPAPAPGPPENSAEDELSDVCMRLQQKLRMLRQDSIAAGNDGDGVSLAVPP